MSRDIEDVRRLFQGRMKEAATPAVYGTVESVDTDARTCVVKVGGISYADVLLYAVERPDLKGPVAFPKVGSEVLLSPVGGGYRMRVVMFSEVDKVLLTIGGTELSVTEEGFRLIRDDAGLKKTLSDLCDAIAALTVSTSVGPSSVPINIADFQAIKQELNDYLEE